jgi:hypothetical protein
MATIDDGGLRLRSSSFVVLEFLLSGVFLLLLLLLVAVVLSASTSWVADVVNRTSYQLISMVAMPVVVEAHRRPASGGSSTTKTNRKSTMVVQGPRSQISIGFCTMSCYDIELGAVVLLERSGRHCNAGQTRTAIGVGSRRPRRPADLHKQAAVRQPSR